MSTVSPSAPPSGGARDECGCCQESPNPSSLQADSLPCGSSPSEAPWGGLCHYAKIHANSPFTSRVTEGKGWVQGVSFFKAFGRKILSNKADPFWLDWRLQEQMVPLPWSRCWWPSRWPPRRGQGQADPSPCILLQLEAEPGWCHLQEERQEDAGGAGGEAWPL